MRKIFLVFISILFVACANQGYAAAEAEEGWAGAPHAVSPEEVLAQVREFKEDVSIFAIAACNHFQRTWECIPGLYSHVLSKMEEAGAHKEVTQLREFKARNDIMFAAESSGKLSYDKARAQFSEAFSTAFLSGRALRETLAFIEYQFRAHVMVMFFSELFRNVVAKETNLLIIYNVLNTVSLYLEASSTRGEELFPGGVSGELFVGDQRDLGEQAAALAAICLEKMGPEDRAVVDAVTVGPLEKERGLDDIVASREGPQFVIMTGVGQVLLMSRESGDRGSFCRNYFKYFHDAWLTAEATFGICEISKILAAERHTLEVRGGPIFWDSGDGLTVFCGWGGDASLKRAGSSRVRFLKLLQRGAKKSSAAAPRAETAAEIAARAEAEAALLKLLAAEEASIGRGKRKKKKKKASAPASSAAAAASSSSPEASSSSFSAAAASTAQDERRAAREEILKTKTLLLYWLMVPPAALPELPDGASSSAAAALPSWEKRQENVYTDRTVAPFFGMCVNEPQTVHRTSWAKAEAALTRFARLMEGRLVSAGGSVSVVAPGDDGKRRRILTCHPSHGLSEKKMYSAQADIIAQWLQTSGFDTGRFSVS